MKISNKPLETFLVIVTIKDEVRFVVENCIESMIPFLPRHMHQKTLKAYAYDENEKLAGIYKISDTGLDLFQLVKACDRSESLDRRFRRA